MSIPLVRNNTKDAINTSIIAIKKNLERINSLLGLADSSEPDLSGLATKQELEDAVTEINNTIDEVETSLLPVNTVTSGDMHSVTSNAVYNSLFPDYANPITIGVGRSWTATEDCYIMWLYLSASSNKKLYINGNQVNNQDYTSSLYVSTFFGNIKKGDILSSDQDWNTSTTLKVYPLL